MNKLYRDTQGNIYAISPIQTPEKEWVALTKKETEAHLNPQPTTEQLADEARLWRDSELARADIELNKVQDGMGIGTVTQWRSYRVALRNWPSTDGWPESTKPVAPDYKE